MTENQATYRNILWIYRSGVAYDKTMKNWTSKHKLNDSDILTY